MDHDPDIREVLEGHYRVIYKVTAKEVQVLAVIHGMQLMPPETELANGPGAE